MTQTEALDLDAIEARAAKATPGVWKLWAMQVLADQDGTGNLATAVPVADTWYRDANGKPRTFDAAFIAHAREDVPALVAEVWRLRDENEQQRARTLQWMRSWESCQAHFAEVVAEATQACNDRDRLAEQLAKPCGSCHPCTNWRDETWRRAGRKPPHVHEWDEARAAVEAIRRLCAEAERLRPCSAVPGCLDHVELRVSDVRRALGPVAETPED